jgi:hypothetical protein
MTCEEVDVSFGARAKWAVGPAQRGLCHAQTARGAHHHRPFTCADPSRLPSLWGCVRLALSLASRGAVLGECGGAAYLLRRHDRRRIFGRNRDVVRARGLSLHRPAELPNVSGMPLRASWVNLTFILDVQAAAMVRARSRGGEEVAKCGAVRCRRLWP